MESPGFCTPRISVLPFTPASRYLCPPASLRPLRPCIPAPLHPLAPASLPTSTAAPQSSTILRGSPSLPIARCLPGPRMPRPRVAATRRQAGGPRRTSALPRPARPRYAWGRPAHALHPPGAAPRWRPRLQKTSSSPRPFFRFSKNSCARSPRPPQKRPQPLRSVASRSLREGGPHS